MNELTEESKSFLLWLRKNGALGRWVRAAKAQNEFNAARINNACNYFNPLALSFAWYFTKEGFMFWYELNEKHICRT